MKNAQLSYTYPNRLHTLIYDHLLDLVKFGEIHPSMTEVSVLKRKSDTRVKYLIKEQFKILGFTVFKPQYKAWVTEIRKEKHIAYRSHIKWDIYLSIDYHFSPLDAEHEKLEEKISVAGNRIVASIFMPLLRKVHLYTIRGLIQRNQ